MKTQHTPSPWNYHNPSKEGSYICRMKNGYIKMCHWDLQKWADMWETTLDGEVKEWMYIPSDQLPVEPNAELIAAAPEMLDALQELYNAGLVMDSIPFYKALKKAKTLIDKLTDQ